MSGGAACKDKGHRAGGEWVVVDRNCNHSAFSGYHRTSSAYSCVRCLRCGALWRTKAQYVDTLRNASQEEIMRPI